MDATSWCVPLPSNVDPGASDTRSRSRPSSRSSRVKAMRSVATPLRLLAVCSKPSGLPRSTGMTRCCEMHPAKVSLLCSGRTRKPLTFGAAAYVFVDEQRDGGFLDAEEGLTEVPTAVLTNFTACYSPLCGRATEGGYSCYSATCPNRTEPLYRQASLISQASYSSERLVRDSDDPPCATLNPGCRPTRLRTGRRSSATPWTCLWSTKARSNARSTPACSDRETIPDAAPQPDPRADPDGGALLRGPRVRAAGTCGNLGLLEG